MTEHTTPTFLHCYLSRCLGLPVDLVNVTTPQLPPVWRQYHWVLELALKNDVPLAISNSLVRPVILAIGSTVAKAQNCCLARWDDDGVYFDWRQGGDTMSGYAGYRGWIYSVVRCGHLWHNGSRLEELEWRRRMTTVAQLCGICTKLNVAGVHLPPADVGWTNNSYFRQCNSIRYRFYGLVEIHGFGLNACLESTFLFSLQISDSYVLNLDCSKTIDGTVTTITFATSDDFVTALSAQARILSHKPFI